jgi:serine/threonine protein kinase
VAGSTLRRLVLSHGSRERYVQLAPGEDYLIGRQIDARFFLNDPSVSRKHCYLRATSTGVELEDLVSRNATLLNGQRVLTRMLLTEGSVLQIGRLAFSVRLLDAAPTVPCAGSCETSFRAEFLTGAPDGRLLCEECLSKFIPDQEAAIRAAVVGQGFSIKKSLGGAPTTFEVEREGGGQRFTVKAFDVRNVEPSRVEQLAKEVGVLAGLEHAAITAVFDLIDVEKTLLLVLVPERGTALDDFVKEQGPLGAGNALAIATGLAEALAYVSSNGVVHGELTPANVLVGEGRPETLGARITNFPATRDLAELTRSFSAGAGVDRLVFFAPEVIARSALSVEADVYGLGAVLLFAATGRTPCGPGVTASEHVRRIAQGESRPAVLDGVPPALVPLLERLLAENPGARPSPLRVGELINEARSKL